MASNARHIVVMYRGPAQRGAISRKDREPMDVFEAIRTMQAVRQYQDRPVADDVLRQVLEAGRLTASGMNAQPWHFIVIQDPETLRQLGTLARTGPYIAGAPVAIAVAVDRTRLAVSDASRAIHSMLLTAWGNGVGGNWVGFGGLDDAKPLLGIPEELDLLAIVPLGYPAVAVGRGKKERKPLAEVASRERYGQPFQ
jgi:nitroreductase